jgi:hypothetical protein
MMPTTTSRVPQCSGIVFVESTPPAKVWLDTDWLGARVVWHAAAFVLDVGLEQLC